MSKIDLHIHSSISADGEFTPQEIMTQCKEQKMELIAITDHNSVRGVAAAMAEADGLKVLSGVEFDCVFEERNFHLLGYGFDHTSAAYAAIEQDILRQERDAAGEKVRLFKKATGIPLSATEVFSAAGSGIVTGELIAELVLSREDAGEYRILHPYLPGGAKGDMPNVQFYWDFFAMGGPAYVPIHYQSLREAIELIHNTGGIAVLAHPGQNLSREELLLPRMIAEGIDGIEVFSSYHTKEDADYYMDIAGRNHLLVTCGSDFHGRNKPRIRLGGHGALWNDRVFLAELELLHG